MNFIQVGDIHIRVRPELPEEWQVNRYRLLFAEIVRLCKEHNAKLFLSGDVADRNRPSLIETKLLLELFALVSWEGIDTWVISGNHEAIGQGASTFDYFMAYFKSLNAHGKGLVSYCPTNVMHAYLPESVAVTFVGHPALRQEIKTPLGFTTQILVSHFRPTVNQFIREEIDVEALIEPFDICFASDIHEPLELHDGKLVYTNSPLNHTFEKNPNCGCLLISCSSGKVTWQRIILRLPNLVQITTTPEGYMDPPDDGNYYRIEVKGSTADLRYLATEQSNVKLLKLPEIAETYTEQEEVAASTMPDLTQALISYMEELGFSNQKVQEMMEVYLEP